MSAHAPGPWVAFNEVVTEKLMGFEVCTVALADADQHPRLLAIALNLDDARLIAAAPDLLAAAMKAHECIIADTDSAERAEAFEALDAAIAKARGK